MSDIRGASATDWFRVIVVGVVTTATLTYAGWLGASVSGMSERMARMETTIVENKSEREAQIADLRARVSRLEDRRERDDRRDERRERDQR